MWLIYIDLNILSWQHFGIFMTILGTYFLAISVRIKHQSAITIISGGNDVSPTKTYIDNKLFRSGLFLVALGSLLQW